MRLARSSVPYKRVPYKKTCIRMIFKEGEMIDSLMGAVSLEELEDLVTRNF